MPLSNLQVSILVDYAHEPESMKQLLSTLAGWRNDGSFDYIIHVVSCDGVGRDDWKKPILGQLSSEYADFSILTTENYDNRDNPEDILNLLVQDLNSADEGIKFQKVLDRRSSFILALNKAQEYASLSSQSIKVLIVSTGVGAEQGLTRPEGKIEWDERKVWGQVFGELARV